MEDYDLLLLRLLRRLLGKPAPAPAYSTAIFRQINRHIARTHHDALEFPDGTVSLLTRLVEGQQAVVLQLPAAPRSREEAAERERVAFVGLLTWDEAAAKSIIEIRPRPGSLFAKPPRSFETVRQCRKSN